MSRQLSPGSANAHPHFQQPATPQSVRQKAKVYAPGIVAGVEDVKYQAKYKDLKRKVKEIEADNDKLQYKVLQAKRNIQRMKLERAILYERLSMIPPSPEHHGRPLPPVGIQQAPLQYPSPHPQAVEQAALEASEHARRHSQGPRLAPIALQHDRSRPPVEEITIGPGMIPPPPHGLPGLHAPNNGRMLPEGEAYRQLPPLPAMQGPGGLPPPRGHPHHLPPPPSIPHSHSSSPSDVGGRTPRGVPASAHSLSPPMGPAPPHVVMPGPGHAPPPSATLSPSTSSRSSSHHHHHHHHHRTNSGRIHNHQRIGPGVNINQAEWERQREERDRHREQIEREREWERERDRNMEREYEREREIRMMREYELGRQRDMEVQAMQERQQHRERDALRRGQTPPPYAPSLRGGARDTPPRDVPRLERRESGHSSRPSRSDSPSSSGGHPRDRELISEGLSRPSSRTQHPEMPVGHTAGSRLPYPDSSRSLLSGPGVDSRKRSRGDMEVDDEGPMPPRGEADHYRSYSDDRDRGYKRHHLQDEPMDIAPTRDLDEGPGQGDE
ncbi:hypothetical protein PUNSTDRAFT_51149 [Punctularia strigosozonata HHB-11173 SS5]|uniref:uncharacterized protein n=1 Tax=Punctularia strigosozonata (strain HHB-11173) TaxID=741275 RepID=UPI0004416B18|nr:uncharacterized protein PUNSTDRAFT_51149 [Punctularia strigosozonata HHB-11173 SS5]EIN10518.1 hypothetical protein PUNSTDRAFT_51149 [Punctularia strigosozonata HHB-11173 SS5]